MLLSDCMFPGLCSLSAIFFHRPVTCEKPLGSRGLSDDGTIRREGSLSRLPAEFTPVVEAARTRIADAFDATQLHSAHVYGSIPRGTAIPGASDLCLSLPPPTPVDRRGHHGRRTQKPRPRGRPTHRPVGVHPGHAALGRLDQRSPGARRDLRPDYPERTEQMPTAAATGRTPSADPAVLGLLTDDLAPWPAAEYVAVHGEKAPRP
ncbi:hypothetical protein [Streptomyces sp. NBC_01320]|uniref:hypothetical protein n=1 Tax=Streptomyces sp. NBC_01320 TaxID=2903824 RepID=UPI002E0F8DFD